MANIEVDRLRPRQGPRPSGRPVMSCSTAASLAVVMTLVSTLAGCSVPEASSSTFRDTEDSHSPAASKH